MARGLDHGSQTSCDVAIVDQPSIPPMWNRFLIHPLFNQPAPPPDSIERFENFHEGLTCYRLHNPFDGNSRGDNGGLRGGVQNPAIVWCPVIPQHLTVNADQLPRALFPLSSSLCARCTSSQDFLIAEALGSGKFCRCLNSI